MLCVVVSDFKGSGSIFSLFVSLPWTQEDSAEERAENCKFWRGTFVTFVFCNNFCILSDNCYHSCTDNSTERPPPHIDHHMCRCSRRRHRCHGCRNAAAVTAATTAVSAAIAAAFWLIVVC